MNIPLFARPFRVVPPTADVTLVFSDGKKYPLPAAVARAARDHVRRADFRAKEHQTHTVPLPGRPGRTLFLVGLGGSPTLDTFRRGVAAAIQHAKAEGLRAITVLLPDDMAFPVSFDLGRAFAEGVLLANYRFTAYWAESAKREREFRIQRVELRVPRAHVRGVQAGIQRGVLEASGVLLARDLVNEPASRLTPASLVEQARAIAKASRGTVQLTAWNRAQCKARGMGAFLAVAQGSAQEPVFIHLAHRPKERGRGDKGTRGPERPRVVLIGKGVTFDSGGLSIKPAEGMETMKIDMAGAATLLGVFSALPKLKLPLEVHGLVAACENMPSGAAAKPGDIVRSVSGKTIEILNTDAEGRLTLADAIGEALKLEPSVMIDIATLTGACVVALGEEVAGLFSNDESTARRVLASAAAAGEALWRLPLVPDYRERLKSAVADLKNVSGKRWGAAITAALFLQEFVGKTPWAHLDIAGPSYAEKAANPVIPVGGTGFGVRTLLRYLEALSELPTPNSQHPVL